jgi:two-component system chemotaxis sensor kinase CheA
MEQNELELLLKTFFAEADEILTRMEENAVGLEDAPDDGEKIQSLFRGAHTLKGNAAALGFPSVAELAHALEEALDQIRAGHRSVTPEVVSLLLSSVDALRHMLSSRDPAGAEAAAPQHQALRKKLLSWGRRKPRGAAPKQRAPASTSGPATSKSEGPQRVSAPKPEPGSAPSAERTLRVDVKTLDTLLNLAGEITTARERLGRACRALGEAGAEALSLLQGADHLHAQLHDAIVRARLVPLGPTFRQQLRTLRDAAARCGRQARLDISGADVMVDTSVVDHLREALVHLIRNALDHGIEDPEARVATGKEATGTLSLRAQRRSAQIVIELTDDGRGLDRAVILERARARGLVGREEPLDGPAIDRLLFLPGFSTSDAVTELSGRGVGLDVVRRRIEAVRGSVQIESRAGAGTTVTIHLPISLAIIDGFHVTAGGRSYVIPNEAVVECREWSDTDSPSVDRGLVDRLGRPLAFVRLATALGGSASPPAREGLVVVDHDGVAAGLVVDAVVGSAPTVVKPLGPTLEGLSGVSGFTILGSGDVALILDVAGLVRHQGQAPSNGRIQ